MENRTYPRRFIELPIQLETKEKAAKPIPQSACEISDISNGGVGILTRDLPSLGSVVKLCLDTHPSYKTEAEVKWTQPSLNGKPSTCGLKFLQPDTDLLKKTLREINQHKAETSLGVSLPEHIKKTYLDDWILKTLNLEDIMKVIAFNPPFLKIEKVIIYDQRKSLGVGTITRRETEGHYNDTIFLALCGQIMGQAVTVQIVVVRSDRIGIVRKKGHGRGGIVNPHTYSIDGDGIVLKRETRTQIF